MVLVNKDEFVRYLNIISKISNSCILKNKEDHIQCLVSSPDNTFILSAVLKVSAEFEEDLNIPDIKKLIYAVNAIPSNLVTLKVNANNLEYKDKQLKFKYHLFDDGLLTCPNINVKMVEEFETNVVFDVDKVNFQKILKSSIFAQKTNKLYFYTEENTLKLELCDRAKYNTDSFALSLDEVDFNLDPIPINYENLQFVTVLGDELKVKINTEYGVVIVDSEQENIKLTYIISSYTQ